jgi:hypothetical protein
MSSRHRISRTRGSGCQSLFSWTVGKVFSGATGAKTLYVFTSVYLFSY